MFQVSSYFSAGDNYFFFFFLWQMILQRRNQSKVGPSSLTVVNMNMCVHYHIHVQCKVLTMKSYSALPLHPTLPLYFFISVMTLIDTEHCSSALFTFLTVVCWI